MIYFSGFCLCDESCLFDDWLLRSDFNVAGFSFGAQKAIDFALQSAKRIDTLQLFSPAFFADKDEKFKRLQLFYFQKDSSLYIKNFLENVAKNSDINLDSYVVDGSQEELQKLLYYEWDEAKLQQLQAKNIIIEVYLGAKDCIIDASSARDFFKKYSDVYYCNTSGHLLQNKGR